ncbi:MAG: GlsB/YeaQ/YmgE family stress response membrane protein [Kineosporiaceae bacterium]
MCVGRIHSPRPWGAAVIGVILSAIIVGLIVGALGRLIVPGRQNISIWLTIAIGIVAALIGGLIASALGVGDTPGIDWIKLIIQVALAAVGVALVGGGSRSRTLP